MGQLTRAAFLTLQLQSDRPETNDARSFQLVQFCDLCWNGGHMLCNGRIVKTDDVINQLAIVRVFCSQPVEWSEMGTG
jgi:uncharacterized protein YuzB (UPF0349 family)